MKRKKIQVVTLGCSKNTVDSEWMMGHLAKEGYVLEHDPEQFKGEAVIINTCGFIGDAKQESIDVILEALEAKTEGDVKKVFVMGCLAQRYKTELGNEMPDVDGFFGLGENDLMLAELKSRPYQYMPGERVLTTPKHFAWLKIAEGCDRKCSFCAIPLIRGKHISRSIEEIVEEAKMLASQGVKELILISQDLTYYGIDLYKEQRLAELVEALCKIEEIHWIRLHYLFPTSFPNRLLEVMAANPKVCRYIDIPLQHINTEILRSMKRGVTREETLALMHRFREVLPDAAIRTTLIVGYPGEGETEFEELLKFVKQEHFDRLGVFAYSPEEETGAYPLGDPIPEEVKQERISRIMELQEGISIELNQARTGKIFEVLIDRKEGDYWVARTQYDSPEIDNEVLIEVEGTKLKQGNFYRVKIARAEAFDLYAEVVKEKK